MPAWAELLAHTVALKPELVGVHPRVFVTKSGLETLRERARTTHKGEWAKVLANVAATKGAPPPAPGPQERRSQNMVAYGTETFTARDFVRTGLVLTVIAMALVMLLGATYWRWLGYV